jgi:anhydro-N-acetylmuramic acid kinase
MNSNIEQLYKIALKEERTIIGLMSGTSVDGLDIAVCKIKGNGSNTEIVITHFETADYTEAFRNNVGSIFSKKNVDLEAVCLINEWIGIQHGLLINKVLQKWNIPKEQIDIIASHGQTIYHAPKSLHQKEQFGNGTLQIGDGDHIAITTGIITLSDFRQKHIAAGGEGAPLAVYGDYLIFGKKGEDRVMLNIGGIANFTYLPATMQMNEVFSTDIGPGNTIMDAYCKKYFQQPYDTDATIAKQGTVNEPLLNSLLNNTFFTANFPKTTGPELFNLDYLEAAQQISNTTSLSHQDVMRTLNHFTAITIVNAIKRSFNNTNNLTIYSSGGGMHNSLLMDTIQAQLANVVFKTTADLNINPDAKEAALFAILANEAISGNNNNFITNSKDVPSVSMGKISFPK